MDMVRLGSVAAFTAAVTPAGLGAAAMLALPTVVALQPFMLAFKAVIALGAGELVMEGMAVVFEEFTIGGAGQIRFIRQRGDHHGVRTDRRIGLTGQRRGQTDAPGPQDGA